ncbi:hypothetical protein [Methylobacterium trifolii]|uniref:Porin n=1 Tax=Methylobacterium trifolii TaxID=1003092 RepID=A0ABQ4TVM8_9HYPH|nr:hypothetical protein [Methylobacterium trifolii]GJE59323.1 hypothetical protein MPOCJGCO_1411 [Methylobacterium trifolii]
MKRWLLVLLLVGVAPAVSGERPARPHLCPEDAPDGVRLPPQPGCGGRVDRADEARRGFHDLGDAVKVKIGGRVGAGYDVRR